MATRTVTIHDTCTAEACGRTLHSIREGETGLCGSCWVKRMPADTRKAMNKMIALAFKPATDAEKDAAVADAMAKLKRDQPDNPA